MDPLKVFRVYLALRVHYTQKNYDIFEQEARVKNCTFAMLEKNKARKILVERLARRFSTPSEVMGYIFPQWLYSNGDSLYDPIVSEENYNRWLKFKANPNYYITQDIEHWDLQKIIMGDVPEILKKVTSGEIAIESAVAIHKVKPFIDPSKDYFLFSNLCNTIVKSTNFIKFDKDIVQMGLEYETA